MKEAATTTQTKAKELDDKHAIVDRTKAGASRAWESVKEVRDDEDILGDKED